MTEAFTASDQKALSIFLAGDFPGIGFLNKAKQSAQRNGVFGWARKSPTGALQFHLEGSALAVLNLSAKIQGGLGFATPESCSITSVSPLGLQDFTLRKDHAESDPVATEMLAGLIRKFFDSQQQIARALVHSADRTMRLTSSQSLQESALHLPVDLLSEPFWKSHFSEQRLLGCSFAVSMWQQAHFRSQLNALGVQHTEFLLDDKICGYEFVDALRLPRNPVRQKHVALSDIEFCPSSVIKPSNGAGSLGVYIIHDASHQRSVSNGTILNSYAELKSELGRFSQITGNSDSWIVEELVLNERGEPAHDLKFYSFYGCAPLALEVRRAPAGTKYCWWNRDGERIKTGQYDDDLFDSEEFPQEFFEQSEKLSLEIPAPFLRIDFLRSGEGLRFCEFTPTPGLFQRFSRYWDRRLGLEFVNAQARLFWDVSNGKTFPSFDLVTKKFLTFNPHAIGRTEDA